MKKVFVVGSATNYADFIQDAILVKNINDADIVLFTGGEDVDPSLYNSKKHPSTYSNIERDKKEKEVFDKIKPTQLALGICRGSQFLCVMNGGLLVQDCTSHAIYYTHGITDGTIEYEITSTHHQMQYPYNLPISDYDVLFKSSELRSYYYKGDNIKEEVIISQGEPEIVLYHKENKPKCLAIQGHPEYMRADSPVIFMLNDLINKTLNSISK